MFLIFFITILSVFNINISKTNSKLKKEIEIIAEDERSKLSILSNNYISTLKILKDKSNKISELENIINKKGELNYIGNFEITFYCGENYSHICGSGNCITKSGYKAAKGITIAVDPEIIPLGTAIYIEGYGVRYAQDTGSAIKGNKIDIFVDSHEEALLLGKGKADVWIIE